MRQLTPELQEALKEYRSDLAKAGHAAMVAKTTPEQRRAWAAKGARAMHRKRKKKK